MYLDHYSWKLFDSLCEILFIRNCIYHGNQEKIFEKNKKFQQTNKSQHIVIDDGMLAHWDWTAVSADPDTVKLLNL